MYIRLLLVEDDVSFANVVTVWLSRSPQFTFEIQRADSLEQALTVLKTTGIDVILADLNLADSSGFATVVRLREQNPVIPIVVLSASEADELIYQAIFEGAQDFLIKPECNSRRLIATLLGAIAREFEASEQAISSMLTHVV